jgi:hypothetical protein
VNAKHTPGPWMVAGNGVIVVDGNEPGYSLAYRLISESPAMHAWIESVISACDNGWPSISDKNRAIEEGRAILKRVSGE